MNRFNAQRLIFRVATMLASGLLMYGCGSSSTVDSESVATPVALSTDSKFIRRVDDKLMLNGKQFRFQGSNNYYMHYKSNAMIDSVLKSAVDLNISVLRVWGFMDGGTGEVDMQPSLGVYTPTGTRKSGFDRLDYTIKRAGELGIHVVIGLSNNWDAFGGVPQYVKWLNLPSHDAFFSDANAKTAYKNYVSHVLNRVNSLTGVAYKDDPTIMTWELMNEPRVESDKTGKVLVAWTKEMSDYVKSLDKKHLVALGDEGFFNRADGANWTYTGYSGVDWEAIVKLPSIDYGTVHLYPGDWGFKDQIEAFGTKWIKDHIAAGKVIGKPVVIEEYGTTVGSKENRDFVYQRWTDAVYDNAGSGSMFWILAGIDDSNGAGQGGVFPLYPDYDGYTIYNDAGSVAKLLKNHGAMMQGGQIERENKVFILSPVNNAFVKGVATVKVATITYGATVPTVNLQIANGTASPLLQVDANGYYTTSWDTTAELENAIVKLTANLSLAGKVISNTVNVTVKNALVWHEITSFTFDNDAQGWQKNGEWQAGWGATPVAQSLALGNGALAVSGVYSGANDWEELRIVSPTIANLSKVQRVSFSVYYPVSAYDSSSSLAQQVRPYIVLNPGWSKQGVDTVTGKLNSYPKVTLNGAEYFKVEFSADWDKLEGITQLYIGLVNNKLAYTGNIYIDDIHLYEKQ